MREAHPVDGWRMSMNDEDGVVLSQPTTIEERAKAAGQCHGFLKMSMPLLLDDLNDHVGHLYSGMPDRLYVIDADGIVTYQSGRGPYGFKPGEMEQALILTMLARPGAESAEKPAEARPADAVGEPSR